MKARSLVLFTGLMSIFVVSCNSATHNPTKTEVDKDFLVAIYSTKNVGGSIDTVSPCLLEETVHISELLHYSDDEGITMPFYFSDTTKYAEITESNIEKRIAISVNGQVVSTPVVKMKLDGGACSVVLNKAQLKDLFPDVDIKGLETINH